MIELPSTRETLSMFFHYWSRLYDRDRFPDLKVVYQFVFEDMGETYYFFLCLSDGEVEHGEGKHESPSITIYSPVSVWLDIANGRLNGNWGWLTRKYRIQGPSRYLRLLHKVFGKKQVKEFVNNQVSVVEDHKVYDFEIPRKRVWKKPDKVIVINGSPRRRGGFTYFYLQYLIKGIEEAGSTAEVIDIYDGKLTIKPCQGCFNCWETANGECAIKDDLSELKERIKDAYLTIYAFPLYCNSIPAKLKAFIERGYFRAVAPIFLSHDHTTKHPLRDLKERYICLFSVNGYPEIEHFGPLVETFRALGSNARTPLVATILRPGAQNLTMPPYRDQLRQILASLEKAGKELVEQGRVSRRILKSVSKDYGISKDLLLAYANQHWFFEAKEREKQ